MHLITPTVEWVPQDPGLEGIYKQIEKVGRSCWASENLITEGSAEPFVENLKKNKHGAPLEHGTVYLYLTHTSPATDVHYWDTRKVIDKYLKNEYSRVYQNTFDEFKYNAYITTNMRVLVENDWLDDLQYLCNEPTTYHPVRLTYHFTCQRAISAEFNRHRKNSPMESSSRYCNYSLDKFGNELNICPSQWVEDKWIDINSQEPHDAITDNLEYSNKGLENYCYEIANGQEDSMSVVDFWWFANLACEFSYMNMIKLKVKPEQARDILPLDLKTELYHTAYLSDWLHFCDLRAWKSKGNKPHPEAIRVAKPVYDNLVWQGYVKPGYMTKKMMN